MATLITETPSGPLRLKFTPPTEEMAKAVAPHELKVISYSMIRPKVRNNRFLEYYTGLLGIAEKANKVFRFAEGWIVRVFIDDSLFSDDYTYSNNINKAQFGGIEKDL